MMNCKGLAKKLYEYDSASFFPTFYLHTLEFSYNFPSTQAMQGMLNHRTTFAIKRMGQVDQKPFQTVFRNYVFKEGSGQKLL